MIYFHKCLMRLTLLYDFDGLTGPSVYPYDENIYDDDDEKNVSLIMMIMMLKSVT